MLKQRNIQSILFLTYTSILVVVFIALILWFYLWASNLIQKNAIDSIYNQSVSTQEKLDLEIQKMDYVLQNVMYSNLVKPNLQKYFTDLRIVQSGQNTSGEVNLNEDIKELTDILVASIGPTLPVNQLYVYDLKGNRFGVGFDNSQQKVSIVHTPWFKQVFTNKTGEYISPPTKNDRLSSVPASEKQQYTISMYRPIYGQYNNPQGIVEVQQNFNTIFKSINDYLSGSSNNEKVIIYNNSGQIMYPISSSQKEDAKYMKFLSANTRNSKVKITSFYNTAAKDPELIAYSHSNYTDWNMAIIISKKSLLTPLNQFNEKLFTIALLFLFISIIISYIAAKKITMPISKIHNIVKNMNLDENKHSNLMPKELNSGLIEMDNLYTSFKNMNDRLKRTHNELLLAQSQELQARITALQTQMNPHFLYNTLSTISVMADENMNEQIMTICENISDILRYNSSNETFSNLESELMYAEKFIEINKLRYSNKLEYCLILDDCPVSVNIPKFLIQPLIENAIKYSIKVKPPWKVTVNSYIEADKWTVIVQDNGPGFSDESLKRLNDQIQKIKEKNAIPELSLGGMGLLNIYLRLMLTYKENMIFEIENVPDGGSKVKIGGLINRERI